MEYNLFDINNFNIIQDEENYYFFRALNMADNNDIEQGITSSKSGKIKRIRTDRERFEGETKYSEDSELSLEEIYDHIKMHYRKDTNCISLTSNSNVAVNYGRGSYKDRYVMIKVPKKEFGEKTVSAGQYMLQELYSRIQQEVENLPEEEKGQILSIFDDIEEATESKTLQDIIAKRYSAKTGEVDPSKAHLRKGITYSSPKARISSYQSLDEEQLLEVNKVYAKLAILENEDILKHVIPHSSNSKLRETIGNAFSSIEVIHYGDINEENIIKIPKEVADIFALIQQVNGIDKARVEALKRALIIAVQNGNRIPQISEITAKVKDNISIEEMYELTEGKVEYGKANSVVKNMFYVSKSRQNAISLANSLAEILGKNSGFEDVIEYIRENGFRVEPEIISRQSGKGVKLSESVNLNLQNEEQSLIDEIKGLSSGELDTVLQNGGLYNARSIITKTFSNISENEIIDKSRYYAEAVVSQYNWQDIGIEEFKTDERNELIARLQEKNCERIYERLKETGMEESKIPTVLFNIAMREGFYEQYENGNLEELLSTRQDILQNNINIKVVERFLGYYDIENTGIRLKDYQQRAYDNINKIFEDRKFAQVILPTGAGKSFVALAQMQKYAQEHPNEKMLYLAPQDEILNQIKKYIVKYVHGKQETLGKSEDEIIAEVFPNITFETYSGLLAKRGQEVVKKQYGMIILDELHRTGAKEWEGKVDTLLANQADNVKVLGITATPTRDVDGRDMAEETAKKLGYTDEEISKRKHLASNMTLENAIRMGYVVNPKLVYCKYDLISSGKMNELRAKIDDIEDETKRAEELKKYNELIAKLNKEIDDEIGEEARKKLEEEARKNLDSGIGKEEILRQNVKKGGKYIVFIPVTDQGEIEDEDGNRIGAKTGEDKIKAYQEYLNKVFEGTDIVPDLHSILGSYSAEKNKEELDAFESDSSDKTKFMVVMNKANEGIHIEGVDGIIWFRSLDENSRILYLQQLGRAIYALDEDNPLPDDKRPTVIDLANNSLTVKMEKKFENIEPIDDLEALTIVVDWINEHDGMIPNRNSSNKQEQHYYAILRRIQSKYSKYLEGFDNFEDLTEEDKSKIEEIIKLATEIDLWNIDLPPIPKTRGSKEEFDPFTIEGVLRDFVELEEEIDGIKSFDRNLELLKGLLKAEGEYLGLSKEKVKEVQEQFKEQGNIPYILKLKAGKLEINIGQWLTRQRQWLNKFKEKTQEEIKADKGIDDEEKRRVLELLELGVSYTADVRKIWNEKLELLKGLLSAEGEYLGLSKEKVKKIQEQFREQGYIPQRLQLKIGQSDTENIGGWLNQQRNKLLNKFRGKTQEAIKADKEIDDEEKRRVLELLELGVSCTEKREDKTPEDIWDENLELLKGLLKAEGEYLGLTKEKVKKVQEQFKEKGYIPYILNLKVGKFEKNIGQWLTDQRTVLKKYGGKTRREIEEDKEIDGEEKRRVLELLELGVGCKTIEDIWDENLELLKGLLKAEGEYLGLTKEKVKKVKEQFEEKGSIMHSVKINVNGQEKKIGEWLHRQRVKLLNKFRGKTQEAIKADKEIDDEEKRRVLELLELGVSCIEKREDKTPEDIWNEKLELLKGLLSAKGEYLGLTKEKVKKIQEQFREQGYISQKLQLKIGQSDTENIGGWLNQQRNRLLNKFRGKTQEEIKADKEIDDEEKRRALELLELGVSFTQKSRTAKEIAEASISSLTDIEMSDREDKELKALVEKTKEGGINLDEQS